MTVFETATLVFIAIISIVFVVLGTIFVIILIRLKQSLDKIHRILQGAEDLTSGLKTPLKTAAAAAGTIMGIVARARREKNKKSS